MILFSYFVLRTCVDKNCNIISKEGNWRCIEVYGELLHEHQIRTKNIFGATENFRASVEQALLSMAVEKDGKNSRRSVEWRVKCVHRVRTDAEVSCL